MSQVLQEFYQTLPTIHQFPQEKFYIPGYTEPLREVRDATQLKVRVIPSREHVVDLPQKHRENMFSVGFPCYYIPIKKGPEHYGYLLKGRQKKTVKYSQWYSVFNADAIYDGTTFLFVVEGIKDAYIFLKHRLPVISMLTSTLEEDTLKEIERYKKVLVVIPDNDDTGAAKLQWFYDKLQGYANASTLYAIQGHKDFGDWFDQAGNDVLRKRVEWNFQECVKQAGKVWARLKSPIETKVNKDIMAGVI